MDKENADAATEELRMECERLEQENELLLQQLKQVQDELKNQFRLTQEAQSKLAAATQMEVPETAPPAHWKILFYKLASRSGFTAWGQTNLIKLSGFFDEKWYLNKYPDVAKNKLDPAGHYLKYGAKEGRNPGPYFDAKWYLSTYRDVAESGMNPLLHYVLHGRNEKRKTWQGNRPGGAVVAQNASLIKMRNEQMRQITELQNQALQLMRERNEQGRLASERQKRIEQIVQSWDKQAQLMADQQKRIEQLIQSRDDFAKKAEQFSKRNQQLEAERVELQARQQLLDQEVVRAEAQIGLIKDVLFRQSGI